VIAALLLAAAIEAGPAVGETIPAFQAVDQDGRVRTFADLRGPKGLVLLFFRSADW
jgi:peroxiredoxin